ncbi:MAG: UBP-type zinc finger domain-containing protein, partial [Nitrosopumilaceae archaeon]|nr:UBP-type zinc finger domain-containing protein [Nitrosopumilaceae archaeon]
MTCEHFSEEKKIEPQRLECEECKKEHLPTVALRMCLTCGHVGCCDSSIGQHATEHFKKSGHPVMQA